MISGIPSFKRGRGEYFALSIYTLIRAEAEETAKSPSESSLSRAIYRQLSLRWLFYSVRQTLCDPIRSKQLSSRLCILDFQFGLYHAVVTISYFIST